MAMRSKKLFIMDVNFKYNAPVIDNIALLINSMENIAQAYLYA